MNYYRRTPSVFGVFSPIIQSDLANVSWRANSATAILMGDGENIKYVFHDHLINLNVRSCPAIYMAIQTIFKFFKALVTTSTSLGTSTANDPDCTSTMLIEKSDSRNLRISMSSTFSCLVLNG